ncbi:MAG: autotransporter-associated beta strand repeat-containing protein, partial [Flavobacteriaceae bacterium]
GTNTYSGTTTISAGTLNISGSGSLGSGTYAGDISNSGTFTYSSSTAQTLSGVISGSGALTKSGSSTLILSGTNTYSGDTTISAGAISVSGLLGNGSYAGAIANSGTLTLSSSSAQTLSGVISGSGGITKSGSGNVTLSGNNTFTGAVTLSSGTLIATANNSLGSSPSITSSSGTNLQISDGITLPSLAVTGAINLTTDVTTTGAQSYSGATVIGTSSGSATTLTTTNSNITFSDTLKIYQNTTIDSGSGAGDITFSGTVASHGSASAARNLIVTAGTGDVTFSDNIKGGSAVTYTYLTSSTHTTTQNGSNPYTISLDLGSDWTYEAKYNSSGWSGNLNTIFSYGRYNEGILVRSPNRGDSFYVRGQNQGQLDLFGQGSSGTAGAWRTVKIAYNSNIAKIYVDGSLATNGTNSRSSGNVINPSTKTIMIGKAHHAGNEGLAATIKDITIVTNASDSGTNLNNLTVSGAGITASGNIVIDGDISITNSGTSSISGVISESANLTKAGAGMLSLS